MNTKQRDTLNIGNANKPVRRINDSLKRSESQAKQPTDLKNPDSRHQLSLQTLEEKNAYLEELLENSRKEMEEAVAVNARFLKIVAHDLRNPFSTTIGILDLLKENFDDWDKSEIKRFIATAASSASNALSLLENLLAWSMSQNIEKTFNPVRINLHELVIDEIELFDTAAGLKQITIDESVALNIFVAADNEMVKTIFRNLISNAIKYTNTGGHIHIAATEGKKFVKIEISDDGIGMSQKTREKLFKIDHFSSISGTYNEYGSGLGLLFCKEFIDRHGGNIRVESEPDKGSKFKFTLPHYI